MNRLIKKANVLIEALPYIRTFKGKTIVIITHKLSEVLAISDDVTVMRDGRVVDA